MEPTENNLFLLNNNNQASNEHNTILEEGEIGEAFDFNIIIWNQMKQTQHPIEGL